MHARIAAQGTYKYFATSHKCSNILQINLNKIQISTLLKVVISGSIKPRMTTLRQSIRALQVQDLHYKSSIPLTSLKYG